VISAFNLADAEARPSPPCSCKPSGAKKDLFGPACSTWCWAGSSGCSTGGSGAPRPFTLAWSAWRCGGSAIVLVLYGGLLGLTWWDLQPVTERLYPQPGPGPLLHRHPGCPNGRLRGADAEGCGPHRGNRRPDGRRRLHHRDRRAVVYPQRQRQATSASSSSPSTSTTNAVIHGCTPSPSPTG